LKRQSHRFFAYQLAVRLKQPNVNRLLRSLTAKQLLAWEEFVALEPFDRESRKADWRAAQVSKYIFEMQQQLVDVVLAAVGVKKSKRPKRLELDLKDYVLTWKEPDAPPDPPKKKQTWQEQWAIIELIQHAHDHGAKDKES
jgi:hypothetical protein